MRNILLLGLQTDTNLGDPLIGMCTEYLVKKACDELQLYGVSIIQSDMRGFDYGAMLRAEELEIKKNNSTPKKRLLRSAPSRAAKKLILTLSPSFRKKYEKQLAAKEIKKQQAALRRADERFDMSVRGAEKNALELIDEQTAAIIFVGGGLIKWKHQRLPHIMEPYLRRADELGIPVMFNAVGVEGFDADNAECRLLTELLNLPCVKCVTTRDDLDTLRGRYIMRDDIITARAPDSACWTNELFPREKRSCSVVGLGMVRGKLFEDHGTDFSEAQLLDIWTDIISELDRRGIKWKLFANGLGSDWRFSEKLLKRTGKYYMRKKAVLPCPETVDELLEQITSFDGIIACRLHTAITAYSYSIPVVEMVWNVKQRLFSEWANIPERFLSPDGISGTMVVDRLEHAMSQGYPASEMDRNATYEYLKGFLSSLSQNGADSI